MKICYMRTDLNAADITVGGSATHVAEFVHALLGIGHEVFVISPGRLAAIDPARVDFHSVPVPGFERFLTPEAREIAYNYALFFKGRKIARALRPAFIYQRYSMHNVAGILLARALGVPFILEANNSEVVMRGKYNLLRYPEVSTSFERYTFELADHIVAVSDLAKKDLVKYGAREDAVTVVPNAVNQHRFRPDIDGSAVREKHGLQGKTVAAFVGLFYPWHGVNILAETIPMVVEKNPGVHFLLIGDGNERPNVERIIRNAGAEKNVTLTGSIPHEDVPAHLAAADILLSPHAPFKDFFGSPTKIFEYMGMGRPTVVSNMGQMGEIIKHEQTGLLVEPGDCAQLRDAILRLAADPDMRARLGEAARADALENYTWEKNARTVVSIYEKLVKTGKFRRN